MRIVRRWQLGNGGHTFEQPVTGSGCHARPGFDTREPALQVFMLAQNLRSFRRLREHPVHGVPGSPYVRAALLSLGEKSADYELDSRVRGEARAYLTSEMG